MSPSLTPAAQPFPSASLQQEIALLRAILWFYFDRFTRLHTLKQRSTLLRAAFRIASTLANLCLIKRDLQNRNHTRQPDRITPTSSAITSD
jgi:hypothetical protein